MAFVAPQALLLTVKEKAKNGAEFLVVLFAAFQRGVPRIRLERCCGQQQDTGVFLGKDPPSNLCRLGLAFPIHKLLEALELVKDIDVGINVVHTNVRQCVLQFPNEVVRSFPVLPKVLEGQQLHELKNRIVQGDGFEDAQMVKQRTVGVLELPLLDRLQEPIMTARAQRHSVWRFTFGI